MPQEQSFFDKLSKGIADAVSDIREKVVEEPMYGRVINERDPAPHWPQAREEQQPAFGSLEQTRDVAQDRDIER